MRSDPNPFVVKDAHFGLRAFESDDLAALYEIESDPFLKQYVGGPVAKPKADWVIGCGALLRSDVVSMNPTAASQRPLLADCY